MMSNKKKLILTIIVIVLILLFSVTGFFMSQYNLTVDVFRLHQFMCSYLVQNEGMFPVSETDLIEKGYLEKTSTANHNVGRLKVIGVNINEYFLYPDSEHWVSIPDFERLCILYGFKLDDIKVKDNLLFDKRTGEKVLLINGPHKPSMEGKYEKISYQWYKIMLHYQNEEKETGSDNLF